MRLRTVVLLSGLSLSTGAGAVDLNARGMGQVLIFPYFTVNGGNTTLITIVNSTSKGKALKIRFHEAYNGRELLDFNVYLSPLDTWTAGLFQLSEAGPANLVTDDNSCTVPAIKNGTGPALGTLPDGRRYVAFRNSAFSGTNQDTGPVALTRAREGFFEVIEMGEVTNTSFNSLQAITQVGASGVPQNCAQLNSAWQTPGGYWTTTPNADMAKPGGGLFGSAAIVNVAKGTMATYNADALGGFSDRAQHTMSEATHPTLADAVTDSAAGIASAYIPFGNSVLRADYPTPARGVDAVSAVLTTQGLLNEFVELGATTSHSEWVVAFPTKQFYVDKKLNPGASNALPPFVGLFGDELDAMSCARVDFHFRDREGRRVPYPPEIDGGPPQDNPDGFCYQTLIVTFRQYADLIDNGRQSPFLASALTYNVDVRALGTAAGWLQIDLSPEHQPHSLRPSMAGDVIVGLPAVGFVLTNYTNSNVTPGVLANYSGTFPHRTEFRCNGAGVGSPCHALGAPSEGSK